MLGWKDVWKGISLGGEDERRILRDDRWPWFWKWG